jgi:uncharacterized protein YyaL (SSP411 family)
MEAIACIYNVYLPDKVVAVGMGHKETNANIKLFENRDAISGNTTVYVCRNRTCSAPITDMGDLVSELKNNF